MNKNQIIQQCQSELANRRALAQNLAYNNLVFARKNELFIKIEKEERSLVFEIGKLKAFGKPYKNLEQQLDHVRKVKQEILANMGLTAESLTPNYQCKICNDLGHTSKGTCTCLKKLINEKLIIESGAGKDHLANFKDFNAELANNDNHKEQLLKLKKKFEIVASSFPNNSPKFIFISGKTGVGKTFLTECLASELIKKGFLVSFISAFGMNNMFLSYHTSGDDQKQTYLNALIDPDVLVVDDLGTEPILKNVTREYLYVLLSERSRLNKLTVITSNLDPSELLSKYNERIFSRLFNKRESFLTQIIGNDLRLTNKKQG